LDLTWSATKDISMKLNIIFLVLLLYFIISLFSTYQEYLGNYDDLKNMTYEEKESFFDTQAKDSCGNKVIEITNCCNYASVICKRWYGLHIYQYIGSTRNYIRIRWG
jgi:hypothetical protein